MPWLGIWRDEGGFKRIVRRHLLPGLSREIWVIIAKFYGPCTYTTIDNVNPRRRAAFSSSNANEIYTLAAK